jgi:hypothetical protein
MKKALLLLPLFILGLTALSAQQWYFYDASDLPGETSGPSLAFDDFSQDNPGPNFVEEIIEDPDIPGNMLFRYIQPDDMADGGGNATRMYRYFFTNPDGTDFAGTDFTIVARMKGLPDWEELGLDRVFDLQYRVSTANARDEFRVNYDNTLELDRSDQEVDFPDPLEWHTYRIVVQGNVSTVYVDESNIPLLTGTSTSGTGDLYLKVGDGSSAPVGGLVDWIGVDVTGAYSPMQSPLDERFTGAPEPFAAENYSIAFITKETDAEGNLLEEDLVSDLRRRGFNVDVTYNNAGEITYTPDFEFSYEALEDYDLVILGRGVSSGDFTDAAGFAGVETPTIILSAYLVRNSRLQLMDTGSASRETGDGPSVAEDRVTSVTVEDPFHPMYTGLDEDDFDGLIGYHTWFYDYVGLSDEDFEATNNGILLSSLESPGNPGDSAVYVALWESGVTPYDGAEVTLAGPRLYFQMGSDDSSDPKIRNFYAFTDESTLLFHNAIKFLLGEMPDGILIEEAGPVAEWTMEGSGETIDDIRGFADGEIRNGNGVTRVSCGVGNSIDFTGATKPEAVIWVENAGSVDFSGDQSFSISFLAKVDPFSNTGEMNFVLKGDNKNDGTHLAGGMGKWYSVATKDNELRFAVDDDVTKSQLGVAIDTSNFSAGEWTHVVAVRDRDQDSLKLYLNGVQVGAILDETEEDIASPGLPLVIGNYHSGPRLINGGIDEVGIYDKALSDAEIADLFAGVTTTDDCTIVETIVEASNDATLSSLTVDVGTLDPAFEPTITSYSLEVPEGTTEVTISATANDELASVEGTGAFSTIPGVATVTVTAEDGTVKDYSVSVSIAGAGNRRIVVEPGFETIELALADAIDGDTLVLQNGEVYTPLDVYQINKKIVFIAEEIPELPGLENMPVIENLFGVNPVFQLNFGADLHLIGIDVDAQQAPNIFNATGDIGVSSTIAAYINRCRLHNTTDDVFNDARDGGGDNTILSSCVTKNTFIYDTGAGHGLYIKNYSGSNNPYVFENITYWNVGQQFNWIRHYGEGDNQQFIFNHLTGYNLSTDEGQNKELFGNSDGTGEAALTIDLKNSILHTQVSTNEGSLKFNNTSGRHTITINNNVLYQLQPIVDQGGSITKSNNQEGVDPMFVDPDNGDFTVMNEALYGAADDGEIIGAVYWHPDYVDDFSDLATSTREVIAPANTFRLKVAPNPFTEFAQLSFELPESGRVQVRIMDITGKVVESWEQQLGTGTHQYQVNTTQFRPGLYIYQVTSQGMTSATKMIKQ